MHPQSGESSSGARPSSVARIRSSDGLRKLVDELRRAADPALGLGLGVVGTSRLDLEDRRRGDVVLLGLARPPEAPEDGAPKVAIVELSTVDTLVPLAEWLASAESPYVVMHDAHAVLYRLNGWMAIAPADPWAPARFGCTRIAATLLTEGTRRHRDLPTLEALLDKLLDRRLEAPALDDTSGVGPHSIAQLAQAVEGLIPIMQALTPRLRRKELIAVAQLEAQLLPAVIAMERIGVGVDGAAFETIAQTWRTERAQTTAADRIARLDKLLSTYAHWPRDFVRQDRIHCLLHPLAADSGRFSCTDPNLQQVPSDHTAPGLRACFGPAPGYALCVADYSQIELRVAASLAPCQALQRVFVERRDPHRATAATITGKPEHEITPHERQLAKAVNFGFLFGMGASRFAGYAKDSYGVELDEGQARRAKDAFFATYPGIAAWHRKVAGLERSRRAVTVRTELGRRKRFVPGAFSFNAALNIPVQGTAADGFKRAMIELHPKLRAIGARGVLCVHDEYLAEVPLERADEARALVETTLATAMATVVRDVPIEVEAKIVTSWAEKR